MIEWVWVKRLGDGGRDPVYADLPWRAWPDDKGNFRPNVPANLNAAGKWFYDDSIVDDLVTAVNVPLNTWMRIGVDESDTGKLGAEGKDWFPEADPRVDEKSRLATEMILSLRGDYEKKADTFFNAIDLTGANAARKRGVKDVLLQCAARGLSETKARAIRTARALPATDADIRNAAKKFQRRRFGLTDAKAREVLNRKLAKKEIAP